MSTSNSKSVMLIDDFPLFRFCMTRLINEEDHFTIVGATDNAEQGLEAIKHNKPDLVLLDINIKNGDGVELFNKIKSQYPECKIIICSADPRAKAIEHAVKKGANGYISKREAVSGIVEALYTVAEGGPYFSDELDDELLEEQKEQKNKQKKLIETLTEREYEVFCEIGNGNSSREIAEKLFISIKTVETHRMNIQRKLKCASNMEMIRLAFIHALEKEGELS